MPSPACDESTPAVIGFEANQARCFSGKSKLLASTDFPFSLDMVNILDSAAAVPANDQHVLQGSCFFTGVTTPLSLRSNFEESCELSTAFAAAGRDTRTLAASEAKSRAPKPLLIRFLLPYPFCCCSHEIILRAFERVHYAQSAKCAGGSRMSRPSPTLPFICIPALEVKRLVPGDETAIHLLGWMAPSESSPRLALRACMNPGYRTAVQHPGLLAHGELLY